MTRRRVWAGVLALALGGLAVLAGTSVRDGLVYYRTPSELAGAGGDSLVRVGGLVVSGSTVQDDSGSRLVLTDGATDLPVAYPGALPAVLHEGEGAVVEGVVSADGVLQAEQFLLRHSNEYRAPEGAQSTEGAEGVEP